MVVFNRVAGFYLVKKKKIANKHRMWYNGRRKNGRV